MSLEVERHEGPPPAARPPLAIVRSPIEKSPELGALLGALAIAQGAMSAANKGNANPMFKSKYADLASVWDACRKPLSDNGLSITQIPFVQEDEVSIYTMLGHSSGQFIASTLSMPINYAKGVLSAQAVGSTITYARRYSLSAIAGIAPDDDDDGNAASSSPRERYQPRRDRDDRDDRDDRHEEEAPRERPLAVVPSPTPEQAATKARIMALIQRTIGSGLFSQADFGRVMKDVWKVDRSIQLSADQLDEWEAVLNAIEPEPERRDEIIGQLYAVNGMADGGDQEPEPKPVDAEKAPVARGYVPQASREKQPVRVKGI